MQTLNTVCRHTWKLRGLISRYWSRIFRYCIFHLLTFQKIFVLHFPVLCFQRTLQNYHTVCMCAVFPSTSAKMSLHCTSSCDLTILYKGTNGILLSAGDEVRDQSDLWARFAVILYDNNRRQFVFSARRWNNIASSYICQLQQQGLSNY